MVGIEYNRLKMHQYFWRLPEIAGNGTKWPGKRTSRNVGTLEPRYFAKFRPCKKLFIKIQISITLKLKYNNIYFN